MTVGDGVLLSSELSDKVGSSRFSDDDGFSFRLVTNNAIPPPSINTTTAIAIKQYAARCFRDDKLLGRVLESPLLVPPPSTLLAMLPSPPRPESDDENKDESSERVFDAVDVPPTSIDEFIENDDFRLACSEDISLSRKADDELIDRDNLLLDDDDLLVDFLLLLVLLRLMPFSPSSGCPSPTSRLSNIVKSSSSESL